MVAPTVGLLFAERTSPLRALLWREGARLGRARDPDAGATGRLLEPLAPIDEGEAVLVGSAWARRARRAGVDVVGAVVPRLRRRFGRVIGVDQEASFALDFDDEVAAALDVVVKPHGLYRDPELYGYVVGAHTADGRWTEKRVKRPAPPAPETIARLHLGVPWFVVESPALRRLERAQRVGSRAAKLAGEIGARGLDLLARGSRRFPPRAAHFVATLTHVQRAQAVRLMRRSRMPVECGLTGVRHEVCGLDGDHCSTLALERRQEIAAALAAEGLMSRPQSRLRFRLGMLQCKAVVSVVGHGELCFRMGEAFAACRILVCQDLSHVRTRFPFAPGENVVYCRPDLSDLVDILDDIECNYARYLPIAERGHADWQRWSASAPEWLPGAFALAA